MKILSWNIQRSKKFKALAEFSMHKHKSDIMFIYETMTSRTNSVNILQELRYENKLTTDSVNHSGGTWILLNNIKFDLLNYLNTSKCAHLFY